MVLFDGIDNKYSIRDEIIKDDPRISNSIMETPSGGFLLQLDGVARK